MIKRKYAFYIVFLSACVWTLTSPLQAGKAQVHKNEKPLDTKQIERLERQLSDIRRRIDHLTQVDKSSEEFTKYTAKRPAIMHTIISFTGSFFVNRVQKDDFRIADRVVTIRRVNGLSQITGYGIVIALEGDDALFEEIDGSASRVNDEVYVINREDTSASLVNMFQP